MEKQEISSGGSVTNWIQNAKNGDISAISSIWTRYYFDLTRYARKLFGMNARTAIDEEDIVAEALNFLMSEGIHDIKNRSDLIKTLLVITRHRYLSESRRNNSIKRGSGRVSVITDLDLPLRHHVEQLASKLDGPEMLARIKDEFRYLKSILPNERLQRICDMQLKGMSNDNIAQELGVVERTVRRKIELIQKIWIDCIRKKDEDSDGIE